MEQLWAQIPGADVALPAEGADGYSVLVENWQVVAKPAVHVADAMEAGRQHARKYWYETWRQQGLGKVITIQYVLQFTMFEFIFWFSSSTDNSLLCVDYKIVFQYQPPHIIKHIKLVVNPSTD